MSLPLTCELGINTFGRARCNGKQRLQRPSLRQPRQKRKQPSVLLKEESALSDSDRDKAWRTVRVRGRNTKASPLSLKLVRRQAAARITKRVKALAANTLDAVGQRQTHATPLAATRTHKQKGSLGD